MYKRTRKQYYRRISSGRRKLYNLVNNRYTKKRNNTIRKSKMYKGG